MKKNLINAKNKILVFNDFAQKFLLRLFDRFGKQVALHPTTTIGVALIFATLSSIGVFTSFTTNVSIFWIPQDSDYFAQRAYYESKFGPLYRINEVILMNKDVGEEVTDPRIILEWVWVHKTLRNITFEYRNATGLNLEECCHRTYATANCFVDSALDFWLNNTKDPQSWDTQRIASLTPSDIHNIFTNNSVVSSTSGSPRRFKELIVGRRQGSDKVESLRTVWGTSSRPAKIEMSKLWELEFLRTLEEVIEPNLQYSQVKYMSARSLSDDTSKWSNGDVVSIIVSYVLMIIYVGFTTGQYNCYNSRIYVTLGAIFTLICVVCATVGWVALFKIPITTITIVVLPYFLIAIGINNTMVILADYDSYRTGIKMSSPVTRLRRMIKNVGVSIFLVCFVYIFAFLIGARNSIPVSNQFCYQTIICIILLFGFQMSLFTAIVVMDAKRANSKRIELFCIKKKWNWGSKRDESWLKEMIRKYYLPLLARKPVKIVVLVFFTLLLGVSLWGAATVPLGLFFEEFITSGYYYDYRIWMKVFYSTVGPNMYTIFGNWRYPDRVLNYTDPDARTNMIAVYDQMRHSSFLSGCGVFWLAEMKNWTQKNNYEITTDSFYPLAHLFLNTSGVRFQESVVFNQDTGLIDASRIYGFYNRPNNTLQYTQMIQNTAKQLPVDQYDNIGYFPYASFYTYYAQWINFRGNEYINLAVILVAMFLLTSVIYKSFLPSLLNVLIVFMIIVETLAFMKFWGVEYNTINALYLYYAAGLGLETTCHFTLKYLQYQGSRKERTEKAFLDIEVQFLHGVMAVFIGHLVPMIFAKFTFYKIFYGKMYLIICGLSILHGLVFMPVLFSTVGPSIVIPPPAAINDEFTDESSGTEDNIELPELNDEELRNTSLRVDSNLKSKIFGEPRESVSNVVQSTPPSPLPPQHSTSTTPVDKV